MNINLINLAPTEWSKSDWIDAYTEYCKANMFGPKTKKDFYLMVLENHKKLAPQTLSDELRDEWTTGWRNAVLWAKKHGCGYNGELLTAEVVDGNIQELKDDVRELQWQVMHKGGKNAGNFS